MAKQATDGWSNKRSSYARSTNEDGMQHITGVYCHCDQLFSFSFCEQVNGEYKLRGRVALRSPATGRILGIQAKERQKKIQAREQKGESTQTASFRESLKVKREITLKSDSEEDIKAAVAHAAEVLYGENTPSLEVDIKSIPGAQLLPAQLVRLHGEKYLTRGLISEQVQRRKLKTLALIASKLSHRRAEQITVEDINKIAKTLEGDVRAKLRLMQKFWGYCLDRGVLLGDNPFDRFFNQYDLGKKRKTAISLQQKAVTPESLPSKVEEVLNRKICDADPTYAEMTGLLLVKEMGLTAAESCCLVWGDILFCKDDLQNVRIKLYGKDRAGATHDYTRPCSSFGAQELHRRYSAALSLHGEAAVKNRCLLEGTDGKRIVSKILTAFCRTELLHAGMSYNDLQPDRSEPCGVGISLLRKNYRYHLSHFCGLKNNQGTLKYLQGLSLAGHTTADHYRSFCDEDGQAFLRQVLSRDGRFQDVPTGSPIHAADTSDGRHTVSVHPSDFDRLTAAAVQYVLQPGEVLVVSADGGICGSYTASGIRRSKAPVADESTNCQLSFLD